ncbi:hypothetical protein V1511DRAFT_496594 [Dipodascopsis uninucleata]
MTNDIHRLDGHSHYHHHHDHSHHHGLGHADNTALPPLDDLNPVAPAPIEEQDYYPSEISPSEGKVGNEQGSDALDKPKEYLGSLGMPQWRRHLQRAQRYSSYIFSGFVSLHVASVAIVPAVFGIEAGNNAMLLGRVVYQAPVLEQVLVLGSLAVHVISGTILRIDKIQRDRKWYSKRLKMSRVAFTGYLLTPIVLGHFTVMRAIPLMKLGDSSIISLQYITHAFNKSPFKTWVVYSTLLGLTMYHVGFGWCQWMRVKKYKVPQAVGTTIFAIALVGLRSIARAGRVVAWMATAYQDLYDTYYSLFSLTD